MQTLSNSSAIQSFPENFDHIPEDLQDIERRIVILNAMAEDPYFQVPNDIKEDYFLSKFRSLIDQQEKIKASSSPTAKKQSAIRNLNRLVNGESQDLFTYCQNKMGLATDDKAMRFGNKLKLFSNLKSYYDISELMEEMNELDKVRIPNMKMLNIMNQKKELSQFNTRKASDITEIKQNDLDRTLENINYILTKISIKTIIPEKIENSEKTDNIENSASPTKNKSSKYTPRDLRSSSLVSGQVNEEILQVQQKKRDLFDKRFKLKNEITKVREKIKESRELKEEMQNSTKIDKLVTHLKNDPFQFPEIPEDDEPAFQFYQNLEKELLDEEAQRKYESMKTLEISPVTKNTAEIDKLEKANKIIAADKVIENIDPQMKIVQDMQIYKKRSGDILQILKTTTKQQYKGYGNSLNMKQSSFEKVDNEKSRYIGYNYSKSMDRLPKSNLSLSPIKSHSNIFKNDSLATLGQTPRLKESEIRLFMTEEMSLDKLDKRKYRNLELPPIQNKSNILKNTSFDNDFSPINSLAHNSTTKLVLSPISIKKDKKLDKKSPKKHNYLDNMSRITNKNETKKAIKAFSNNLNFIFKSAGALADDNKLTNKEIKENQTDFQKFYENSYNTFKIVEVPDSLKLNKVAVKNGEFVKLKNILAQNLLNHGNED